MPVTVGLAATPGNRKLRFDIGAAGGFEFALACGVPDHSCSGFDGELHAGVNASSNKGRRNNGFAAEAVVTGAQGGGLAAPLFLLRFSFVHRNPSLE